MRGKRKVALIIALSMVLAVFAPLANVAFADETSNVEATRELISKFAKATTIGEIDADHIDKVNAAADAYDALTAAEKAELAAIAKGYHVKKLSDAKVDVVHRLISYFRKAEDVNKVDDVYKAQVEAAIDAYAKLSKDEKKVLDERNKGFHREKLEAAEVKVVHRLISLFENATPVEEIDEDYVAKVAVAEAAYEKLTAKQKGLLEDYNKGWHVRKLLAGIDKVKEYEELEEEEVLEVVKVSAITETYVAVEIAEVKEDSEEPVTIEVKDSEGKVREVKPVSLIKGDKAVEFEFVKAVETKDLKGVWTVEGIDYDIDLVTNLEAFKEETNQLKFVEVLNELGIENVEVANIPTYMGAARTNFLKELKEDKKDLTVEAIQEFINEVNAKVEEEGTEAEVKEKAAKAVVDAYVAKNDVALKIALENDVFERFNAKWLVDYKTEFGTDIKEGSTVENIQAKLDAANTKKLKEIKVADSGSEVVDRAKLNEYKELIDTYAKKDKDGKIEDTEVAKLPKAIDIQLAIVDVREATTPTRLKPALENLAELTKGETTKFEMKDYKDENAKYYINGIAAGELATGQPKSDVNGIKKADVKNVTNVNTVITEVNDAVTNAETAMEERINTLTVRVTDNPNYDSSKKGKIHILGYTVNIGLKDKKFSDAESVVVKLYRDKEELGKIELRDPSSKESSGPMDGTIDLYGDYDSTSWAHEWYGELTDMPNRAVATVTFKDGVAVKELETLSQVTEEAVKPFYRELANRAETVEEMDAALLKLAEIGNNDYLNVPKADRLYVAEQVLEARNAVEDTKKFAKYTDLTSALNGIVGTGGTYTNALAKVNKLNKDSQIADVIAALSFDEGFAKMSVAEQSDVAEAFFNSLFEDGEFVAPNFRTLAAVKAAAGL